MHANLVYCVKHALYIAINLKVAVIELQRLPRAYFLVSVAFVGWQSSPFHGQWEERGRVQGKDVLLCGQIWPWSPGFGGAPVI